MIPPALSAAAFAARPTDEQVVAATGRSMGTGWRLRAAASSPDAATALGQGVQAALDRVVAQMSQWEPDSDLSRFNRAPAGQWRMLPPEMIQVLAAALDVARLSGGAFDPAMGALTELWGFGVAPAPAAPPSDTQIAGVMAGDRAVECDAPGLRARRGGSAQLDFSGIAKGFGVDHAADWLIGQGCRHFLLEVGGELRGAGIKLDGQPWWVEIEQPPGVETPPMRVALHQMAIATSGDYRRWLDADGRRYAHTIDPRSGRSIDNAARSVTVLHARCMMADAWATALSVLGADAGMALAEREGLAARMLDAAGEHMSPAFRAMLD